MTPITPERLVEIERTYPDAPTVRDLCAALREAWTRAERADRGRDEAIAVSHELQSVLHSILDGWYEADLARRLTCQVEVSIENVRRWRKALYIPAPQALADLRARIEAQVWKEAAELAGCCAPPGEWNDPQAHWIACAKALATEFTRRAESAGKYHHGS